MAQVILKKVRKCFGQNEIIRGVDLTIEDGEFLVMVGPSGCGKSTLLRSIAGLETLDAGDISIDGRVVNELPPKERDVAMVFQSYALYPHMTVWENMAFGLSLRKLPKVEIVSRVEEAARLLELTPLLQRKPKALSGGQRQRVAIGRAIVRKPKLFLFDEPLSNLDTALRVQMRGELARLHQRLNTTMVYVTHDQVEAMTLASRVAVFHQGVLQQVGKPLELYDMPQNQFVAGFLGSPSMNFFKVQIQDGHLHGKSFHLPVPSGFHATQNTFLLGIRPQDLRVNEKGFIRGTIEAVERMGFDGYAYLQTEDGPLVARFDSRRNLTVGENVFVDGDMARCHLFSADGQEAFWHPQRPSVGELTQ